MEHDLTHPSLAPAQASSAYAPDPVADTPLNGLLDRLETLSSNERVSVDDLVAVFGANALLPLMLVPALVVVSPASGIPLLPTVCGIMIFLIASQMALGRSTLWLPQWLCRRSVSGRRLSDAISWLRRPANWLDRHSDRRLHGLTTKPMRRLLYALAALCGGVMPLLELVPFSSSLLALSICLIGLSGLTRDGLWALIAVAPIVAACSLIVAIWF